MQAWGDKASLCPHKAHGLVGESKHGNSNFDTLSKNHRDEEKHKKSQREKGTKRNPEVLMRKTEAETQRAREQEGDIHKCKHTCTYTRQHLCGAGVQRRVPSQESPSFLLLGCGSGAWGWPSFLFEGPSKVRWGKSQAMRKANKVCRCVGT